MKKGVLTNFAEFTGKHLCQNFFLNKVAGASNFIKKEALAQVLSCEFCEICKNTFYTEHHWVTASEHSVAISFYIPKAILTSHFAYFKSYSECWDILGLIFDISLLFITIQYLGCT